MKILFKPFSMLIIMVMILGGLPATAVQAAQASIPTGSASTPAGLSPAEWKQIQALLPQAASTVTGQQAYLKASNTGADDGFGVSAAISGDTLVVGAPQEDSSATGVNGDQGNNLAIAAGAAYVFTRSGSTWSQQAYLKASNTEAGDEFGTSVAISGDTLVVAAVGERSNATGVNGNQSDNSVAYWAGAAYVFTRSDSTWSQQAYLKASNTGLGDRFGNSVAISGDTVVVGAEWEDSSATGVNGDQSDNSANNAGAAYVFTRSGSTWSQRAYLKASNTNGGTFGDMFGNSVSISGDTLVVGAYEEDSSATGVNGNQNDNSASQAGAAYVFARSGTDWSQQAYLKASNTGANDSFGVCIAISGDTLVVGAYDESSNATGVNGNQSDNSAPSAGAAYVFTRSGSTWSQQAYLKASNTGSNDRFGITVAISGDALVVAAPAEGSNATGVNGNQSDNSAANSGAAYMFTRSGSTWSQQAYLKASNTDASDGFGIPVAISGDTLVVGAQGESSNATGVNGDQSNNSAQEAGAAYTYLALPERIISGNAGVAGSVLSYQDGTDKTVTAGAGGAYSLPVTSGFAGTVTPSKAGYTFTPPSRDYSTTPVTADLTGEDFVATPITFTISGNADLAGAKLSYTDVTAKTVTADAAGDYSLVVSYDWSGTVTPSKAGRLFTPGSRSYTHVLANKINQDYSANAVPLFSASPATWGYGVVKVGTTSPGRTFTVKNTGQSLLVIGAVTIAGSNPGEFVVVANACSFAGLVPNGTCTIRVAFRPTTGGPKSAYINFIDNAAGSPHKISLSGNGGFAITGNAGVAGAVLRYTDGVAKTAVANGTGDYSFVVSSRWSGTVTPSGVGYGFSPPRRAYLSVTADKTAQNYVASRLVAAFSASPTSWNYGAVQYGTMSAAKTFTVKNTGQALLVIGAVVRAGANPGQFVIAANTCSLAGLAPSATCTISVAFRPTTGGPKSAYINFTDNATGSPHKISLSGNGGLAISGSAGVAGATLRYTDGVAKTATANSGGGYSIVVSYNWSGSVTPLKTGYKFTPTSRAYTNVTSNKTGQNYTQALSAQLLPAAPKATPTPEVVYTATPTETLAPPEASTVTPTSTALQGLIETPTYMATPVTDAGATPTDSP